MKNRALTDLKNIGEKIAARLHKVGIQSESDLKKVGAVQAHKRLKARYPNETLPVCYYLYSFEGALTNKHWNDIGKKRKETLKDQAEV